MNVYSHLFIVSIKLRMTIDEYKYVMKSSKIQNSIALNLEVCVIIKK